MRKSNWIIIGILVVASILFLWVWQTLQFSLVDNPLDIIVTVIWWVVIIGTCIAIHLAEQKRRERIRTMFLAPGLVYNSEYGMIRLDPGASPVEMMRRLLVDLHYDFNMVEPPTNSRIRFQRIVRTAKFSDGGRVWEGEVVEIAHPDRPHPFHDRNELEALLASR